MNNWENAERTVTLTNDQWNLLTTFILMSTNYRKGEIEAWEQLSTETNDDGTAKFKHAADNAKFMKEMDVELEKIRKIIDGV